MEITCNTDIAKLVFAMEADNIPPKGHTYNKFPVRV